MEAPAEKEDLADGFVEDECDEMLDEVESRRYRGLAARMNYLSQDRSDTQFAAKEVCRSMATPRISSWGRLKRLARYLLAYPRLVWRFAESDVDIEDGAEVTYLNVYSDSDWAGDKRTRKSTSGGVAVITGGAIKSWSSTQGTIALSVGEAEYYAMVKAAAEGLALVALGEDLGFKLKLKLWVDSNAAKAIASRLGLGRVRHMEVKFLWAQEALRKKEVRSWESAWNEKKTQMFCQSQ